jgi:tetratricopeptide (TPR) repeat protein
VNEVISAQGLQPNQLEVLRDAFIPALVRVEADGTRGRSRAYREELPRSVDELLQRFVDARLLVTDRDREGRETVEVAHDALLRVWTQLDSWLAQDEDKLRLREGIHRAAEEWNSAECKPDLLLHRGEHLTDALALLHEPRFAFRPMSVEARYIAQCEAAQRAREQAEKEAREQRIRDAERIAETQKKVTMRTRIALIVVLILAFLAAGAGMRAQNNAKLAEKSQDIVLEAINQFTSDASNLIDENKFSEVFAIYSRAEDALAFGAINDANNLKLQFAYASIIKKLGDVFGMEGNYGEAIKRYEKAIGKLDQIIELHPENEKYKNFKAGVYRNIAFSQIYNRQPGKAVIAAERGLNLNPDSAEIKVMLAHAYLFDSQIDKAKSIYLENRDVKLGNQLTFREVVLRDFKYFTSNGLTHPDMANIEHLLNDQR